MHVMKGFSVVDSSFEVRNRLNRTALYILLQYQRK